MDAVVPVGNRVMLNPQETIKDPGVRHQALSGPCPNDSLNRGIDQWALDPNEVVGPGLTGRLAGEPKHEFISWVLACHVPMDDHVEIEVIDTLFVDGRIGHSCGRDDAKFLEVSCKGRNDSLPTPLVDEDLKDKGLAVCVL